MHACRRAKDYERLIRVYSGASVRYTNGQALTLDQAQEKIRAALARAAEDPRAQWSWGIVADEEMIGLISVRRRSPSMGTLSYILRDDAWGHGYATEAAKSVVDFAFTTATLSRLEAMHHPDNPASGRILTKCGFSLVGTHDQQDHDGTVSPYPACALPHPTMPAGAAG
ncbi:GNAT family N-acetyltransferase [Streptomyces sp. NPDC059957]|uniref:GNAT family N-acetyltransferase n=1 Tax=unclassified Streptomyces TaxID=2593676 RepID=UPI00365EAEEF